MSKDIKNIVYLSMLLSLVISCPCGASQPKHPFRTLDGTWWLSISANEKLGFVEGFFECSNYEIRGPDKYSFSFDHYVELLTKRYQADPSEDKESVAHELHEMRDKPGESFVDPYAEPEIRPTGLEWEQMDAVAVSDRQPIGAEHRGFVEGYIACHAELNHNKGGVFSKSADTYVSDIDHWYGYVESTGYENPDREDTTIAQVLFKFADKPSPRGRPSRGPAE